MRPRPLSPATAALTLAAVASLFAIAGCTGGPSIVPPEQRTAIDRAVVERPVGLELTDYVADLTAPTAIAFETADGPDKGTMLFAEGGIDGSEPRVYAFRPDGTRVNVYPKSTNPLVRFTQNWPKIYGPVNGIAVRGDGEIYIGHRDANGRGQISAIKYDGTLRTVVGGLPAVGDFGVNDLAFHPSNRRLYFGVGSATNSGVVGIDNWQSGWLRKNREVSDVPAVDLQLHGSRFDTPNPMGGLLGGDDIAVTAPFQPFGSKSNRLRIPASPTGKPSAAIYSISAGGGDLRVEAHGLHNPAGLAFTPFGNLLVANQGMELRGTRPIKDDPDSVVRLPPGAGTWFGWPDFSTDLQPITDERFKPPVELVIRTGYPGLLFLIDHTASGLIRPDRGTLVRGVFDSLSGASKMTFIDDQPGFESFSGNLLVALAGDRYPFATGGTRLKGSIGHKIARLDPDTKQSSDFVYNTAGRPAHEIRPRQPLALERPIDVKFGPDGALYIVDLGQVEWRSGKPTVKRGTGKILRLAGATTTPATQP